MRNIITGVCVVVVTLLFLSGLVLNIVASSITNDVDGWINSAKGAGSAKQMYEFTNNAIIEMERLEMTDGYVAPFPKRSDYDMEVTYNKILDIRDRTLFVHENTSLNTIQQSQALADLRVSLGSVRLQASSWWLINHNLTMFWIPTTSLYFLLGIIGIFLWEEK